MTIIIRAIMTIFLLMLLAACAMTHADQNSDYQQGITMPTLKMPPGVKQSQIDPYYQVPGTGVSESQAVSMIPPGSLLEKSIEQKATATHGK